MYSTFTDFKDAFIASAEKAYPDKDERQRLALKLFKHLKALMGEGEARLVNAAEKGGIADRVCDFWGAFGGQLCLFRLDDEALERDDEVLEPSDFVTTLKHMLAFVERSCDWADKLGLEVDATETTFLSALIAGLNRGEIIDNMERLSLYVLTLNPMERQDKGKIFHCGNLIAKVRVISIEELWKKGVDIDVRDETSEALKTALSQRLHSESESSDSDVDSQTVQLRSGPVPSLNVDASESADEYRETILRNADDLSGIKAENVFREICQALEEGRAFEDIEEAHCFEKTVDRRVFSVDGYAFDETNSVLRLFLLDYDYSDADSLFTTTDLNKYVKRLSNFLALCQCNRLARKELEIGTEAGALAYQIENRYKKLDVAYARVDLVVLTLRHKSPSLRYSDLLVGQTKCRVDLWDVDRLYEISQSQQNLIINFIRSDFGGKPLRLLRVSFDADTGYASYVGSISGETLASIYGEYGQGILSSNVRAFLLTGNKVNKGIQKTIVEEPQKFFAYNNGVCVVADSVKEELRSGLSLISAASDFQIVNGGQTTASLHYAQQRRVDISSIYVPIKLSVIAHKDDENDRQEFVQLIAQYANSQNKVTDSDLGSNTKFQIQFAKVSNSGNCRTTYQNYPCNWYYERARGSYRVDYLKSGKAKSFERKYPRQLKFGKTDLAKWLKSWNQEPHIVSFGAQKCFLAFSKDLRLLEKNDPELKTCSDEFFRYCAGKGILFRHVDDWVKNTAWYQERRSYKANIVAYSVAYLAYLIDGRFGKGKGLNFLEFWRLQQIPSELNPLLDKIAQSAQAAFNTTDKSVDDIGEWVKKEGCWRTMCNKEGYQPTEEEFVVLSDYVVQEPRQFEIPAWSDKAA